MNMNMTIFPTSGCHVTIGAMSRHHHDLDTIASASQHSRHPQKGAVQVWEKSDWWFWRYCHFWVLLPVFLIWPSETWPQNQPPKQLITQSAQATANAIASTLTSWTTSISLPIYYSDSKNAHDSFSIFWCTQENWLLLNCIATDSKDHLWYVFTALGTKSLEMRAQWMLTGDEEKWRATKAKASAFLNKIQQGMTHNVNTHVWLGELEAIVARPGEDPQDLAACIKTLMDHWEMINDEHKEHELHWYTVHAYHHERKLFKNSWPNPSRHLLVS